MIGAPKGPEKKEKPKEAFESVAKGFKLVVEKIKKWWESGSKPEERDFTPVAEARDSVREELRDQNERDGKPGRPFVASRSAYGEAAGMIGNPEVSLSVGDPILLQGKDGAVVDRLVTAEDVEVAGGTFNPAGNAVNASGNWVAAAGATFTSSGTVTFDAGSGTKTITSRRLQGDFFI